MVLRTPTLIVADGLNGKVSCPVVAPDKNGEEAV